MQPAVHIGQTPAMHFTAKQLRHFKLEALAQRYRAGRHPDPVDLTGTAHVLCNAAIAKRERKNAKRARDICRTLYGEVASRERLNAIRSAVLA